MWLCALLACGLVTSPVGAAPAALSSAHPEATAAGVELLQAGGNAFDAAVAVSAVLAVVEPYSSGLGGGGFWLLHRASDGQQRMLDGREMAPGRAERDLYAESIRAGRRDSLDGPLAAAIPGVPAALVHLSTHYGCLPLARALAPAIRLARQGFTVDQLYQKRAAYRVEALRAYPESARLFLRKNEVPQAGVRITQPELAATLELLAREGRDGFYHGAYAERLVRGVQTAGGIWELADLAAYEVREREPIRTEYRGARIISASPPSSGGIVLALTLRVLAQLPERPAADKAAQMHQVIEAMRRAYHARALYLGDPDFTDVPVEMLLGDAYARQQAASFRSDAATPSASLPQSPVPHRPTGTDTTHFSIIDAAGNRVAATLSINLPFGSAYTVPGTGLLLNNEMDDFSIRPGLPNAYGLIGGQANAIAPGKRPLSSMSPTFVETGQRIAVLGTPGGSRIISMVLLGVLDFIRGNDPDSWVRLPRYHHQYLPDEVQYETAALEPLVRTQLQARGHQLRELDRDYGNMHALQWDQASGVMQAAADPRGAGQAQVLGDAALPACAR